eukprot:4444774-Prorocentrum_lima.AAC.1
MTRSIRAHVQTRHDCAQARPCCGERTPALHDSGAARAAAAPQYYSAEASPCTPDQTVLWGSGPTVH